MASRIERHEITLKRVVYQLPGVDQVSVRRDVSFGEADDLTMDLYYPPQAESGVLLPAVVIVAGYPDVGVPNILGCKFKEMEMNISWGQLIAASGLVAITYTTRSPVDDVRAILRCLQKPAPAFGIRREAVGFFASSGNGPTALSLLTDESVGNTTCVVLCCPFTIDLYGSTAVAEAALKWKFIDACAGQSITDLRRDVPLFIARAGQDQFGTDHLDHFVSAALSRNLPVTVVNHADGPHAFDLFDNSKTSCEIIRQMLAFMRFHLLSES